MLPVRTIRSHDDVAEGLDALMRLDPRLIAVKAAAGEVPLRQRTPGYAGLAQIVISQQVSRASANAIWGRLTTALDPLSAKAVMTVDDDVLRTAGLSRPKMRTLRAVADAVGAGFSFDALVDMPCEDALAALTALHGIGPWTAEVYMMFCLGAADLFPARDVALQAAIGDAFAHDTRPGHAAVAEIATLWTPWRSVAARLFWAYYAAMRRREAVPV